ncbi:hypothetical protein JCM11641_006420 [Rhodosporidiobolus odoratus]
MASNSPPPSASTPSSSSSRLNQPSSATPTAESSNLRSRKLSLSTQRLPTASASAAQLSPSQSSYSTSPTSRTDPSNSLLSQPELGLGLMLDDNGVPSPRASIDSTAGRSRGNSFGTADRASGNHDSDEFFLSAAGGTTGNDMKPTPSGRIPKPSTVGTSSPLPIFTGSPNPAHAQYASPLPSPVPTPRAFSPAPSHQAYNLGGPSSSTAGPSNSAPMSRPPSYNSIMASSAPMDRGRSGGSDIHSRQQSLTSACPPVTAAALGTPKSEVTAFGSPAVGAGNQRGGWRSYDWGVGAEKAYDSAEDVREGAKRRAAGGNAEDGLIGRVLAAPAHVLAFFLRPINSGTPGYSQRHPHSPTLNGSGSPSKPPPGAAQGKRYPLPIRLLTFGYLIFSFLYLTLSISSSAFSPSPAAASAESQSRLAALRARLGARGGAGQEGWQLVKDYADGGLEKLGWARYKSGEDGTSAPVNVPVVGEAEDAVEWGPVRRVGPPDRPESALQMQDPKHNPLTPFSHTYRFSKMHDKVHWDLHDEIVPFAFHASAKPEKTDVTACLYSNEAWLDMLPAFLRTWRGPVSLIFEATHSRLDEIARTNLLTRISTLRNEDSLVKQFVDFHLVGTPFTVLERTLNKTRERLIKTPTAYNYQLNLARFFAQTDIVFLVGDARITPSGGLRRKLTGPGIRNLLLERGDALVVPTFGFIRDPTGEPSTLNSIPTLRAKLGLSSSTSPSAVDGESAQPEEATIVSSLAGVSAEEFAPVAAEHIHTLLESLPLSPEDWPTRKQNLVSLVNTRIPSLESPTTAQLALYDRRWDLNHGPSNWYLWRKSSTDPRLLETPSSGGGLGLGLDGAVGGGKEVYRVVDYDLHYAPLVVVSKKGQPWCTERFDDVKAACVYQMYLSGAEMWVVPDEWAYTLEVLEKRPEGVKEDPAEKLKNSIQSRLYGKFHQEACMHYGREFLSMSMWDSDKAQHLRETCARTLGSWGMGSS